MITILYDYLNAILIFFSLTFGLKYLYKSEGILALKILGIQLLINFIFLTIALYVNPVDLWKFPYLIGYIKPMVYLFPAFTFLFHYYLLRPGEKFNVYFLLLFLPFLFAICESLPFILSTNFQKLNELKLVFEKNDYFYRSPQYVWLPPLYHIYAKIIFYIVTGAYLLKDFFRFNANKFFFTKSQHPFVNYWLIGIVAFRFITIVYTLNTFIFNYSPHLNYAGLELLIVGDSIFCILFLLLNPKLLDVYFFKNFINQLNLVEKYTINQASEESELFINEYAIIHQKINELFTNETIYLDSNFTVERLANELKLPQRVISFAIKQVEGISVRDYINKIRMEYLIKAYVTDEKVRNYSFDYLAEMAGFGSRQTMYSSSQKFYNCSPKELFEKSYLNS